MSTEPARSERWFPLLFLALAVAAVAAVWRYPTLFAQPYDWRYFESWIEVGRRSVVWFHQVPLWNPYGCGGEVLLANPQSMVASPLFVLPLLFGTAVGIKLALVVYFFCAFHGMYRLARDFGLEIAGALLASVLFGAGGWLALHVSSGHANFASASLFPYLWLSYRRGLARWVWTIPLGAIAAWIICDGGTSTPAMATVLLATVGTIDAIARRPSARATSRGTAARGGDSPRFARLAWLRPFAVLALGAACAAALSAWRLLPALEFALDHPRRQWETDSTMIWEMLRDGYLWRGVAPVARKRYWFHEYGWRLSYLTPPLILWSLRVKKTRSVWIVIAVGAGIVAGSALPYGPWWLLKHLPLFRDLRVPSRYAILFALGFPLLCGGALDDLCARLGPRRWVRGAAVAVIALAAVDGLAFDWYCFHDSFAMQMEVAARGAPFYQIRGEWRSMMNAVMVGHGAIGCDEEAPLQRAAALDEGPGPQVKLDDATAGTIASVRWTPNRVEVDLVLDRPATVLLNQNWNEHWRTSAGEIVKYGPKWPRDRDGGRLAVAAPAGRYTLTVDYRPRSFVVGAWVSLLATLLLSLLVLVERRRLAR
jgi:hypothetical protein